MTAYNLKPPETLPSLAWQEAKEKRKKLLAAVHRRRAVMYQRSYQKKRSLQSGDHLRIIIAP